MIFDEIKNILTEVLDELGFANENIRLEHPADLSNGDYSTNVAMVLAGKIGKKPVEIAEKIIEKVKNRNFFGKVEVAGSGFINFFLSSECLDNSLREILEKGDAFGRYDKYGGRTVLVEYTDPNAFKVFHIGHLMSNAIGEAISRIVDFSNGKVIRICYPSDIGLHIAKAVWGMAKKKVQMPADVDSLFKKTDFLGACYVFGTEQYEKSDESKKEIDEINRNLFSGNAGVFRELYEKGKIWSLEHFDEIYVKLGTKFDRYIYESEVGEKGAQIVRSFLDKGIFERSEGAIIFPGEKYGLHTRVFINSVGLPIYEAKEIGLNIKKFELYPDAVESIVITGNEQNEYFKVLIKALLLIDEKIGERTKHFGHGMLRFADGKMSSRTGKVIAGDSLISDVGKLIGEKIADRDFEKSEKEKIINGVSVGAIKYSILRQATGANIVYDFGRSISFDGDSGPYLQYSYARAISVIRKAGGKIGNFDFGKENDFDLETKNLQRVLSRFPEIVRRSANEYEPHYITTYLTELAGLFNSFYAKNPILGSGVKADRRLALTRSFSIVMKNGLNILAIPVLERM